MTGLPGAFLLGLASKIQPRRPGSCRRQAAGHSPLRALAQARGSRILQLHQRGAAIGRPQDHRHQRPIEEFLRHNEENGWPPGEHLADGTRVNVPDPGFPPLIAARLSAAVLADGPPGPTLSALLRQLVPVTGADVTAQATVIARLLLCSPTQDARLLTELHRLMTEVISATTAESTQLPHIAS